MALRVRIGALLIECDDLDDLQKLIERFGGEEEARLVGHSVASFSAPPSTSRATPRDSTTKPAGASDNDWRLLRALTEAGASGVPAGMVCSLLGGVRGRAVTLAIREFSVRVGLDGGACVPIRSGTIGRRWRLTSGALGAARLITGGEAKAS